MFLYDFTGKAEVNVELDVREIKKGDVPYIDVKGWKHTYNLKDKSDVVFENLFNGNQALGTFLFVC